MKTESEATVETESEATVKTDGFNSVKKFLVIQISFFISLFQLMMIFIAIENCYHGYNIVNK